MIRIKKSECTKVLFITDINDDMIALITLNCNEAYLTKIECNC